MTYRLTILARSLSLFISLSSFYNMLSLFSFNSMSSRSPFFKWRFNFNINIRQQQFLCTKFKSHSKAFFLQPNRFLNRAKKRVVEDFISNCHKILHDISAHTQNNSKKNKLREKVQVFIRVCILCARQRCLVFLL